MVADPPLHLTVHTAALAAAAARLARLLPGRPLQPELAGVLLRATDGSLELTATDGELVARARVPATVFAPGAVLVPRRALAATVAALDAPELRLAVEGSRLAVRTPQARFALPVLDLDAFPPPLPPPPVVGTIAREVLRAAAAPVAGAASREPALPMFTGVRVRSMGEQLSLVATDRYRMATARVAWHPAGGGCVDALVPATFLAEVARLSTRVDAVGVHAEADRFGLSWGDGSAVTALLGAPFPDRQLDRLLETHSEGVVEIDAGALAGAVERAVPYAGPHGKVCLQFTDGAVLVRGADPLAGESEEALKAALRGNPQTKCFQARFLLDALRPFGPGSVLIEVQAALRAAAFTAASPPAGVDLRYLVVPMRPDAVH